MHSIQVIFLSDSSETQNECQLDRSVVKYLAISICISSELAYTLFRM